MYKTSLLEGEKEFDRDEISIDIAGHEVKVGQKEINLTVKEFELLLFLVKNRRKVISRLELLQEVWASSPPDGDRRVDVHVCRLRKKLELDPQRPKHLVAIRGLGYKLLD